MKALKNIIFPVLAVMLVISSVSIFAQEKEKSELNKKLADLKGKVEKVTVKVDGKDVVFEGKDAENLVKKMKSSGITSFAYSTNGENLKTRAFAVKGKKLAEITEDDGENEDVLVRVGEAIEGKEMKNIKIEKNGGKTVIHLTETDKDGKPVEKVLEGDEAEKYLKENNEGVIVYTTKRDVPVRVKSFRARAPRTMIIKRDNDDEDDDAEAVTVYVTKGDKGSKGEKGDKDAKEITIKKVIKEKKQENKEN